jgi:hypothetical protein
MTSIRMLALAGAVVMGGVAASPLAAQERQERRDTIPAAYNPPPGMCRIWVDGVPAAQQPAPTDCSSAVKNRPANGRVIFGARVEESGKQPPFLRSFSEKDKQKEKEKERKPSPRIPSRRP